MNDVLALAVEWAPFRLASHASESQLLSAAESVDEDFLSQQPGYIRRELLKGNSGRWVDLIYWQSLELSEQAFKKAKTNQACQNYFTLMESTDTGVSFYQQTKRWGNS